MPRTKKEKAKKKTKKLPLGDADAVATAVRTGGPDEHLPKDVKKAAIDLNVAEVELVSAKIEYKERKERRDNALDHLKKLIHEYSEPNLFNPPQGEAA